jgi:quercetin 2,3-dioxygenase
MQKSIHKITQLAFSEDFPGLKGVNIMERSFPIEPFLVFTEFHMNRPVFGPHPHAGISVMTYMLPDSEGSFINRDSKGDNSIIEPGGMHIMQAGSGMHHDEFPKVAGIDCHGFQIWINHSSINRMAEPLSMHAMANEIAEFENEIATIRVIHGSYKDVRASYKMLTDVNLYHVFLKPNAEISLHTYEMAFIYVLKDDGLVDGNSIVPQTLVNFGPIGDEIKVTANNDGLEFMFGTGTPLNEPIVYGGPFVMSSAEQMQQANINYSEGKMGRL